MLIWDRKYKQTMEHLAAAQKQLIHMRTLFCQLEEQLADEINRNAKLEEKLEAERNVRVFYQDMCKKEEELRIKAVETNKILLKRIEETENEHRNEVRA